MLALALAPVRGLPLARAPLPLAPTTVRGVSAEAEVLPGAQWVLALRRWCNLRPSSEFRCYGLEGGRRLLAVCQRDRFSHYPFLEAECPRLLPLLAAFAERHLGETVGAAEGRPALALPRRLVWDAYVDLDSRVHLIDVAPFHHATDPLLFDWAELGTLAEAAEDAGEAVPDDLRRQREIVGLSCMQVPHYAALRAAEEFYWGMMPLVILRRALRGWSGAGLPDFSRPRGQVPAAVIDELPPADIMALGNRAWLLTYLPASAGNGSGAPSPAPETPTPSKAEKRPRTARHG